MSRCGMVSTCTEVALLVWLIAAAPVGAGSAFSAGGRAAGSTAAGGAIGTVTPDAAPTSFQEVTAAFTATPTTGGLGDAAAASRATFSATEPIEFNAVLFESGLAGTRANLQLWLFDPRGQLVAGGFFANGVLAPSDRTGFFVQLSAGTLAAGRFTWLMVIFDAFGNVFVTPFQVLAVQ